MNITSNAIESLATSSATASNLEASAKAANSPEKLRKVSKQLEGIFYSMMIKEMRKTVPQDTLLPDDAHQQDIFQEMMDDKVGQQMADQAGSNGLGAQMYNQLSGHKAYAAQKVVVKPNNFVETGKVQADIVR